MSRTYAVFGDEFHLPKTPIPKHKDAPAGTEARNRAMADAIDPQRAEEIHAEAQAAAAEIMRWFELRSGR